jgi:hypothetical protein
MIVRKFTCREHQEFGFTGWRPDWVPHFDPSEGLGVAHDTLEHQAHDKGTVETELMAFGAVVWIRELGGWFQQHTPYMPDVAHQMSGDFLQQAEYLDGECRRLRAAPTTRPLADEHAEDAIQRCVQKGMEMIRSERPDENLDRLIDPTHAASYMRMGFRRAEHRYGRAGHYDMAYLFSGIRERADKLLKCAEIGDQLIVRVDVPNLKVHADIEYPE